MKKKQLWKVMAALCAAALLAGCGESSSSSTKQVVVSADTEAEETAGTDAAEDENAEAANTDAEDDDAEEASADAGEITIEEQVLFEQDDIKVTAVEYFTDSIWGDGIKYLVENNSDKDIVVTTDAMIVNNYMISDYMYVEVAAGKKANEEGYLSSTGLEEAGIDAIGQIELYLRAYDSETYEDIWESGCVTIQTSAYDSMETPVNDEGTELYNANGIRIVGKTVDEDSFWGTAILLYIENNSDRNVGIRVEDFSINGYMIDEYFSSMVYSGKKTLDEITIFDSDLEENGIESIDEVELSFHIYDEDSYDTIADSDPITFSAQQGDRQ